MSVLEDCVLWPLKASDKNPDEWPQFNLSQIKVTSLKNGQNASLLSAHQHNPLKVSGRLEPIDNDLIHLVRDKSYIKKSIEIDQVSTYAFAEYADGTYGFWAAGKAGWYEIQSPASSFKTTYDQMNEAASIFYMLADRLRRARKRAPNFNDKELKKYIRKICLAYCAQRKNPTYPADVDEARAMFHKHREFLMTSMLEGQDGLDWMDTPILTYLKSHFPNEYAEIEARIFSPAPAPQARSEAVSKDSRDSSRKRKSKSPHDDDDNLNKKQKRKAAQQAESRIQLLPKGLLPKTPQAKESQEVPTSTSDEDEETNMNGVGRKQKSILQPSGGKYSKKAAARQQGLQATWDENSRIDEGVHLENSPITTLRNAEDLGILTNPPDRSSQEIDPTPRFLPRKYLELKLVDYDLPSTEPQGPGDLWTCTFEGCFHRVHEASTTGGKRRMQEHFKTHASQAQEKIDLALDESRPYLPVNNLVRRLQAFASLPEAELGPDSLERKFSAPIQRRY